jgi:hypothetical protein
MVIGYGFGDDHINEILIRASASGAKLFLVDPAAHKALSSGPATKLRENIIGISSRPLSTTLHNDPVERMKLFSFFQ